MITLNLCPIQIERALSMKIKSWKLIKFIEDHLISSIIVQRKIQLNEVRMVYFEYTIFYVRKEKLQASEFDNLFFHMLIQAKSQTIQVTYR